MRIILLLGFIIGYALNNIAQIKFELSADAKQVLVGEYLTVTYTIFNAKGSNLIPPSFDGFKRMGAPSQSFQSRSINGRTTIQTAYSFVLLAQKTGSYKIGSAKISAQGKQYESNTLIIEVLERKSRPADQETLNPVYVNLELSTDTAYLGQQVLLDYKLYTTVNVRNFDIRFEPEYENAYAVNIPTYNNFPNQREIINGESYVTKVMKRVALFPMQFGIVVLEPATINLGIEYDDPKSRSFFFRSKLKMERIQTNEASITILPLPDNAPIDFNGAVGDYAMRSYIKQRTCKTNEALSMIMTITGTGDEKRLLHPELDFGPAFDIYDPKVMTANNDITGPIIKATKQLEYLIVPKQAGDYTLNPSFSYFNPDSAKYMTIKNEIPVRVLQGSGTIASKIPANIEKGKEDIRFIHTTFNLKSHRKTFFGSVLHYIFLAIPIVALSIGVLYKRHLVNEGNLDMSVIKKRRARKIAFQRLAQADVFKKEQNARNFYDEISKASLGYVSDKYNIPSSELSKTNIKETIFRQGHSEIIQDRFLQVLNTCEMALFAGQTSAKNLEDVYQEAVELIASMEEESTN